MCGECRLTFGLGGICCFTESMLGYRYEDITGSRNDSHGYSSHVRSFIGGFYGIMHVDHTQRMERKAADQCWVDGGTYTDGECKMPEDGAY